MNISKGLSNNECETESCCHAEEHVINKFKKIPISKRSKFARKTLTIMVIRISKAGTLCNSKPCVNCLALMRKYNITRVVYSDHHGQLVKEKVSRMESNHITLAYRALLIGNYQVEYKKTKTKRSKKNVKKPR